MEKKGTFIVLEGCEGVGKSTQMRMLSAYLTERNIVHTVTREPGGGAISEAIRKVILNGKFKAMTDECEALLYAAARVQHLSDTVIPALNRGELVLCDRYIFSSYAYQGNARGLDMEFLQAINSYAVKNYMPDLTLFLDLHPGEAFARKHGADRDDRIEQQGMAFHERVYEGYKKLVEQYPEQIQAIDCSGEREDTHAAILAALRSRGIIE